MDQSKSSRLGSPSVGSTILSSCCQNWKHGESFPFLDSLNLAKMAELHDAGRIVKPEKVGSTMMVLGSWATAILRTHQHSFTQAHTPSENRDKTTVCDLAVFSECARTHLEGPHLHIHPYFLHTRTSSLFFHGAPFSKRVALLLELRSSSSLFNPSLKTIFSGGPSQTHPACLSIESFKKKIQALTNSSSRKPTLESQRRHDKDNHDELLCKPHHKQNLNKILYPPPFTNNGTGNLHTHMEMALCAKAIHPLLSQAPDGAPDYGA